MKILLILLAISQIALAAPHNAEEPASNGKSETPDIGKIYSGLERIKDIPECPQMKPLEKSTAPTWNPQKDPNDQFSDQYPEYTIGASLEEGRESENKYKFDGNIYLKDVKEGSPAQLAGLKNGDRVVRFVDEKIPEWDYDVNKKGLVRAGGKQYPGQSVTISDFVFGSGPSHFVINRNGQKCRATVYKTKKR